MDSCETVDGVQDLEGSLAMGGASDGRRGMAIHYGFASSALRMGDLPWSQLALLELQGRRPDGAVWPWYRLLGVLRGVEINSPRIYLISQDRNI